ncbi:hypothetical protein [Kerstersia gyiorum]|uniref:hypothetical protein n=1 Tax=Kerstersia gyiorum TaxID=206506 RepID=UPI0014313A90|nr:hypothetical protein [Kerstersia gyiorum]MCP1633232.1 hypothetical protein [Kerstersia gyiorum]MCP1636103.1 hypothetical protein [Kerstersia gyiorum]MCP1671330.1 hypothetical protein [Kerstersia gyiorum]MCP1679015.1 hypothetical protein [Kerstersia gyiorum]MCP1681815.1 hypothetical protein [Kerstersia gyiorum]
MKHTILAGLSPQALEGTRQAKGKISIHFDKTGGYPSNTGSQAECRPPHTLLQNIVTEK